MKPTEHSLSDTDRGCLVSHGWTLAQESGMTCFGTSAGYITACMKAGIEPGRTYDLSRLRAMSSTGSPLPAESFEWVYEHVKKDIWLVSISGGADVCSALTRRLYHSPCLHRRNPVPTVGSQGRGVQLDDALKARIEQTLRTNASPHHVPDEIIAIKEVPRTLTGKKMEVPVKKLFMGVPVEQAVSMDALSNPQAMQYFIAFAQQSPMAAAAATPAHENGLFSSQSPMAAAAATPAHEKRLFSHQRKDER